MLTLVGIACLIIHFGRGVYREWDALDSLALCAVAGFLFVSILEAA
jgi:hypothetical protein